MLRLTLLSEEDAPADYLLVCPRYCSAVMEGFVVGAASVSCMTPRLKQEKRENVNLSGIIIACPIDDVKYITTKS